MQSTDPRQINKAIWEQANKGTRQVTTADGYRVIRARKRQGQLQAKQLGGGWINVESVSIR